ncbi:MAG: hypothetical protein HZB65_00390 [Candidatus Aenigmarchaeota archaeon]|nr:hypothetical protein [Candidatus Aenigmarchaeota archaeon]
MATKTIKDVDEKTWRKLRTMSAESNIKMAALLKNMAEDYEKRSHVFWRIVLEGEKILSDKEADEIRAVTESLRKEHGFRKGV